MEYQYEPLNEDDIRIIRLLPGTGKQPLQAEIIHQPLVQPKVEPEEPHLSRKDVNETLPEGWESYTTPEGRWVYDDITKDLPCQYHHPAPELAPACLRQATSTESWIPKCSWEGGREGQFEALSYVWGDATPCDTIQVLRCEDRILPGHLPIGSNLREALLHLRHPDVVRALWVDAVSINQKDIEERNAQVLRMADIYSLADRVVVWLGKAGDDSGLALKTLDYLGNQLEITNDFVHLQSPNAQQPQWFQVEFKLPYSKTECAALEALILRPWFSRVWVLQEVTLANRSAVVQCGNETILYYYFRRAIAALRTRTGVPDDLTVPVNNQFRMSYGLKSAPITDMINIARVHMCSVPHDKIYGLLGFFGPKLRAAIQPAYEKNFADVYTDIFLEHSRLTGRLELLAHSFPVKGFKASSWVPDWRSLGDHWFIQPAAHDQSAGFSCANFRRIDTATLEVTGVMCGSVSEVCERLDTAKADRVGSWLRRLIKMAVQSGSYPTGETLDDALAKLLCRNQVGERFPGNPLSETIREWKYTLSELLARREADRADDQDLEGFVRTHWKVWKARRFFKTTDGYLGLGPDLEVGDCICVVLGLSRPLLLRPAGHCVFTIVGHSYVQGLMDSEALVGQLPQGWTIEQESFQWRHRPRYRDTKTDELHDDDPRLGPVPEPWRRAVPRDLTADDPEQVDFFENAESGKVINHDPRLSVDRLKARGVPLCEIRLI